MRCFLSELDPEACSIWVVAVLSSDLVFTYVTPHISSCVIQEKEIELMQGCFIFLNFDQAKRLIDSGVSVQCRDKVC